MAKVTFQNVVEQSKQLHPKKTLEHHKLNNYNQTSEQTNIQKKKIYSKDDLKYLYQDPFLMETPTDDFISAQSQFQGKMNEIYLDYLNGKLDSNSLMYVRNFPHLYHQLPDPKNKYIKIMLQQMQQDQSQKIDQNQQKFIKKQSKNGMNNSFNDDSSDLEDENSEVDKEEQEKQKKIQKLKQQQYLFSAKKQAELQKEELLKQKLQMQIQDSLQHKKLKAKVQISKIKKVIRNNIALKQNNNKYDQNIGKTQKQTFNTKLFSNLNDITNQIKQKNKQGVNKTFKKKILGNQCIITEKKPSDEQEQIEKLKSDPFNLNYKTQKGFYKKYFNCNADNYLQQIMDPFQGNVRNQMSNDQYYDKLLDRYLKKFEIEKERANLKDQNYSELQTYIQTGINKQVDPIDLRKQRKELIYLQQISELDNFNDSYMMNFLAMDETIMDPLIQKITKKQFQNIEKKPQSRQSMYIQKFHSQNPKSQNISNPNISLTLIQNQNQSQKLKTQESLVKEKQNQELEKQKKLIYTEQLEKQVIQGQNNYYLGGSDVKIKAIPRMEPKIKSKGKFFDTIQQVKEKNNMSSSFRQKTNRSNRTDTSIANKTQQSFHKSRFRPNIDLNKTQNLEKQPFSKQISSTKSHHENNNYFTSQNKNNNSINQIQDKQQNSQIFKSNSQKDINLPSTARNFYNKNSRLRNTKLIVNKPQNDQKNSSQDTINQGISVRDIQNLKKAQLYKKGFHYIARNQDSSLCRSQSNDSNQMSQTEAQLNYLYGESQELHRKLTSEDNKDGLIKKLKFMMKLEENKRSMQVVNAKKLSHI